MHASAVLISDLHLTPSMPRTAERFFEILENVYQENPLKYGTCMRVYLPVGRP